MMMSYINNYGKISILLSGGGNIIDRIINNIKRTKLWVRLNQLNEDYSNNALHFIEAISPILDTIVNHFPYYTRHDSIHGLEVLKRISEIANPDIIEPSDYNSVKHLNACEIYLLICSAFAHDLGMTVLPGEKEKIESYLGLDIDLNPQNEELQDYLRSTHSIRGGDYIRSNNESLKVPEHVKGVLDTLMQSHNFNETKFSELRIRTLESKSVDMKRLCALLCIADLLEFSNQRVIDGVIETLKTRTDEASLYSYYENMKHKVIGYNLSINNGVVQISADFEDPEVLHRTHKTVDSMDYWLKYYVNFDNQIGAMRYLNLGLGDIDRDFNMIGYMYSDKGISIRNNDAISLVTSDAMWGRDYSIPVRELIQNSVEACRYRIANESIACEYKPLIEIELSNIDKKLIIHDNGCGMSSEVIIKNLLSIANSRSNSQEYRKKHDPLARFGLGFWSCFTIAEKVELYTCSMGHMHGENGYKVVLDKRKLLDYNVLYNHNFNIGTKVILHLTDEGYENVKEITSLIDKILTCSQIPLTIRVDGIEVSKLTSEIMEPTLNDMIKTDNVRYNEMVEKLTKNNIKMDWFSGKNDKFDYVLGFAYMQSNEKIRFLGDNNYYIFNSSNLKDRYFKSVCGFKVSGFYNKSAISICNPEYACYNIRSPRGIDFELRRNRVIENDTSKELAKKMKLIEISHLREFLHKHSAFTNEIIYEMAQSQVMVSGSRNNYNIYKCFETEIEDLIVFRVVRVFKIDEGYKYEYVYYNLAELIKLNEELLFVESIDDKLYLDFLYPNSYCEIKKREGVLQQAIEPYIFSKTLTHLEKITNKTAWNFIDPDSRAFKLFLGDNESVYYAISRLKVGKEYFSIGISRFNPTRSVKENYYEANLLKNSENDSPTTGSIYEISIKNTNMDSVLKKRNIMYLDKESELASEVKEILINIEPSFNRKANEYIESYGIKRFIEELRENHRSS